LEETGRCFPDFLLLLQPTSPLRTASDCTAAIELATAENADAVVSVVEMEQHPAAAYVVTAGNRLSPFGVATEPGRRRQERPRAVTPNGAIYLNSPASLRASQSFVPEGACAYEMPRARSVDIDSEIDLEWASFLLGLPEATRANMGVP
jgi:CMP-N-acetylneuraminic acid synthetase